MIKNKNIQAHLAIIGANLIFGLNYTFSKGIMPDFVQPYGLTLMRTFTGIIVFWLLSLAAPKERIERNDILRLFFAGIFGMALNQLLFLGGLNFSTPINSAIIMTTNPVIVLVVASLILNEKITQIKTIGIIFGATGAILLILMNAEGGLDLSSDKALGNIMQLLNATSYAIYLIVAKPLMKKYHPYTVLKWAYLFALLFVFPVGIRQFMTINWVNIPIDIWLAIGYLMIFVTVGAFLLNIFALQHVSPTVVSSYIYSQPVIAAIFAILSGKDKMTWIEIISTSLVFMGVYLVSRPAKAPKNKPDYVSEKI
ncbi:MAG: DMT family transporter [Bacteroidales bacterium]|nr:DMT family transporter [Bacteroidales bacterium]